MPATTTKKDRKTGDGYKTTATGPLWTVLPRTARPSYAC
jgi:hypothetical protein